VVFGIEHYGHSGGGNGGGRGESGERGLRSLGPTSRRSASLLLVYDVIEGWPFPT
jgi:hypothetical protein